MESEGGNSIAGGEGGASEGSRRYGLQFPASGFMQAPLTALLEYSGIMRNPRSNLKDSDSVVAGDGDGEVSIRIIGSSDHDNSSRVLEREALISENSEDDLARENESEGGDGEVNILGGGSGNVINNNGSSNILEGDANNNGSSSGGGNNNSSSGGDSTSQRYDIQQAARWIELILPFSLLLLVVFIRQHLQGTDANSCGIFFSFCIEHCCLHQFGIDSSLIKNMGASFPLSLQGYILLSSLLQLLRKFSLSLQHYKLYHAKRCIMGLMQPLSRPILFGGLIG